MIGWGSVLQTVKQISRDASDLLEIAGTIPRRKGAIPTSTPARFSVYRDPKARFELRYPTTWECLASDGVLVRSPKIATFARVDVVPESPIRWLEFEKAVEKAGGELTIEKHLKGPPKQVRGKLQLGGVRFAWNAYAYEHEDDTVVLFTANVIDPERGARIERFEDRVLEGIRREFRCL